MARKNYVPVALGIDMSSALRASGKRLSKAWLREYLRTNPQKDFRNLGLGGSYVNGQEALSEDLTLQVYSDGSHLAFVNFQATDANEWGYQAVVS